MVCHASMMIAKEATLARLPPDCSQGGALLRSIDAARGRGVTAVLGPTNTGKTHLAIERMLGHETGLSGLPLRLLAREVYD
ncbi:MAG: hypothetical protein F9K44_10745, partial [Hyphomicrobiaceae bacterium]